MSTKFKVTEKHIQQGHKSDKTHCPIALSLREYYQHVLVDSKEIYLDSSIGWKVKMPANVRRRIKHYDRTGKMQPFEFELLEYWETL